MKSFIQKYSVQLWLIFCFFLFMIGVGFALNKASKIPIQSSVKVEECKESVHTLRIDYPHAEAVCQYATNKIVIQSPNSNVIYVSFVCK
jgi:hypothetical protein